MLQVQSWPSAPCDLTPRILKDIIYERNVSVRFQTNGINLPYGSGYHCFARNRFADSNGSLPNRDRVRELLERYSGYQLHSHFMGSNRSAGSNPEIDILFNGVKVDAQPFSLATTPKNQFSGQKPAPATSSVTVEALAAAVWDDLYPAGETSQVVIAVPTNCAPPPPSGCTVTQGGWGAPAHGDNPGAFLNAHFASGFPSGATIGGSPFQLLFTSAQAVRNFLPQGGPPSFLTSSATNPTTSSAGVFGGQVLALDFNVVLHGLGSLTLSGTGTSLDGSTVSAVLAAANMALAGGPLPTGFTYSSFNDLIDELNQSFDGCVRSGWAATHLRDSA